MLEVLKIKNVAIIDSVEVQFAPGLNIISGETGAGKSIILEAISLILGSRASVDLIRSGAQEAIVEGLFKISEIPWMFERLTQAGFEATHSELIIKRTVHRGGKHRISINGELATLTTLQGVCDGLIDLCGQSEHQTLLRAQTQLNLLDQFGELTNQSRKYSLQFQQFRALSQEKEQLGRANEERTSRAAFLKYQIDEILQADLRIGEDAELHHQKQLLQSAEVRAQSAENTLQVLEAEDQGVQNSLRLAIQKAKGLVQLDPNAQELHNILTRALAETEEAVFFLSRYLNSVDLDPEQLQLVQARLSQIAELKRKYGAQISDILERLNQFQEEFRNLDQVKDRLSEVLQKLDETRLQLIECGTRLSKGRKKAAQKLSQAVTRELKDLKMADAQFFIELLPKEDLSEWGPLGADQIQFLVQTNRGEQMGALAKIASGGELSRLMLAIRRVIADRGGIGVYLFDEIDAGMGGQTAFQVGKKLKSVAQYNQVICITHLPQVASFADHHLVVKKGSQKDRTTAQIIELPKKERQEEIARMLGGPVLTRKSLENASELLELAGN